MILKNLQKLLKTFLKKKKIYSGLNSKVYLISKKKILKKFIRKRKEKYSKEIKCLKILSKENFVPKLLEYNDKNFEITMTYCGENINSINLPKNWKRQIKKIQKVLNQQDFVQADIELHNICVLNKKIFLIDFGSNRFKGDPFFSDKFLQPSWLKKLRLDQKKKFEIYKKRKHDKLYKILTDLGR